MRYIKYLEVENFKSFKDRETFHFGNFDHLKLIFDHQRNGNSDMMDAMSFVLGRASLKTNRLNDLINQNGSKNLCVTASVTLCCCTGITTDENNSEIKFTRTISTASKLGKRALSSASFQINQKVAVKKYYVEKLRVMNLIEADEYCLVLEGAAFMFSMKSRQQQTEIFEIMIRKSSKLREKCKQLNSSETNEKELEVLKLKVCKYYLMKLFHYQQLKADLDKCVEESSRTIQEFNKNDMKKNSELRSKKIALKIAERKLIDEELNVRNKTETHAKTFACLKLLKSEFNSARECYERAKNAYNEQKSMLDQLNQSIKDCVAQLSGIKNKNKTLEYDILRKPADQSLSDFFQQLKDLQKSKLSLQIQCQSTRSMIEDSEIKLKKEINSQTTAISGHKRKHLEDDELVANKKMAKDEETLSNKNAVKVVHDEKSLRKSIASYQEDIKENKTLLRNSEEKIDSIDAEISKVERDAIEMEDGIFDTFCRSRGVQNIREFEADHFIENQENNVKKIELEKEILTMQRRIGYERRGNLKFEEMNLAEDKLCMIQKDFRITYTNEKKEYEERNESIRRLEAAKEERNAIKTEIDHVESELHEHKTKIADFGARRKLAKLDIEMINERRHQILIKCKEVGMELEFTNGNWNDVHYYTKKLDDNYAKEDQIKFNFSSLESELKQQNSKDVISSTFKQFENIVQELENNGASVGHNEESQQLELENEKNIRLQDFMEIFQHVNGCVDKIYKELTGCASAIAILSLENTDEPYFNGVRFEFVPPGQKSKKEMHQLPIEEGYVAAMALLMAIQRFQNLPEEEQDDFNSELEAANIKKLAQLIQSRNQRNYMKGFRIIVKKVQY